MKQYQLPEECPTFWWDLTPRRTQLAL